MYDLPKTGIFAAQNLNMPEVKPYNMGDSSKKEEVRKMFNNIAPKYDLLNRLLSMGIDQQWRKKALRTLDGAPVGQILDMATGTGDLAIMANKMYQPEKIIGVDLAPNMLSIAEKKASKLQMDGTIEFREGDAEQLPFEDGRFDAATVAFGVRNFGDLEKGLSEMRRVLKKGGRIVVLEFTMPRMFPFRQIYHGYFRYILPAIGKITSKDPKAYRYLYESVQAFPDYDRFTTVLEKVGFSEARYKSLSLGICAIYTGVK